MRIGCVIYENRHLAWAEKCDFDYLEIKGDYLLHLDRTGGVKQLRDSTSLTFEAMTSPLPRELGAKIVGPAADHTHALSIFTQMISLAAMLGVKKIVLGSGQARAVPVGFNINHAHEQYIDFLNKATAVCLDRQQILTLEPLHSGETNFINSCVEAQKIIKYMPEVGITADCYHIFAENLDINEELSYSRVMHAHTSYLPRATGNFLADYQHSFLNKIQGLGCNTVSIEEKFDSEHGMREILLKLRTVASTIREKTNLENIA